jgi:uncharacterized membrane protein YraQ (UPF0718 family)
MMNTSPNTASQPANFWSQITRLKIDPVIIAVVLITAALAILDRQQIPESLGFMAGSISWIAPFFALSIAVAAYAKATGAEHLIARVFSGNPIRMIIAASVFGALSPFCSCGVIPIIAGLLVAGVPLAPVMAFWLSSPLMDPQMFVISSAGLGLEFTSAKTVFAIMTGFIGGFSTMAIQRMGYFDNILLSSASKSCCGSGALKNNDVNWKFWQEDIRRLEFSSSFKQNAWFLGKWLTFAFFIESLMVAYVPASLISEWLGQDGWWALPSAVLIGIPTYLNGFAAVPLMAELIDMGMLPGAAMSFMVAGGITSIPAAIAVFALVRRTIFMWYILIAIVSALLSGGLYQLLIT